MFLKDMITFCLRIFVIFVISTGEKSERAIRIVRECCALINLVCQGVTYNDTI